MVLKQSVYESNNELTDFVDKVQKGEINSSQLAELIRNDKIPKPIFMGRILDVAYLPGVDLSDCNLRGANLCSARLQEANLSRADLSGAFLDGAEFRKAIMEKTILRGANLTKASFGQTNMKAINLSGAILSGASFNKASLIGADLQGADLRDSFINEINLKGANLCRCNLQGARIYKTDMSHMDLNMVDFRGASLYGVNLRSADIENCALPSRTSAIKLLDEIREAVLAHPEQLEMNRRKRNNDTQKNLIQWAQSLCGFKDPDSVSLAIWPAAHMTYSTNEEILQFLERREYDT